MLQLVIHLKLTIQQNSEYFNRFDASARNTTGQYNISMGVGALRDNVAGNGSVAIGYQSMLFANSSSTDFSTHNTAVGYESLRGSSSAANNTGTSNTAIGYLSLRSNTEGVANTGVGAWSVNHNTTGDAHTA